MDMLAMHPDEVAWDAGMSANRAAFLVRDYHEQHRERQQQEVVESTVNAVRSDGSGSLLTGDAVALGTTLPGGVGDSSSSSGENHQSQQPPGDEESMTDGQAEVLEAMLAMKPDEVRWDEGLDETEATRLVALHRDHRQRQQQQQERAFAMEANRFIYNYGAEAWKVHNRRGHHPQQHQ